MLANGSVELLMLALHVHICLLL